MTAWTLQAKDKYKDTKVGKLIFSRKWWQNFRIKHGFAYKRVNGTKKLIPQKDLQEERARLKKIMSEYEEKNVWNLDESGLLWSEIKQYSWYRDENNAGRSINFMKDS